jgi:hypothetical protein
MRWNIVCQRRVFYPILFLGIFISWLLVSFAASQKVKTEVSLYNDILPPAGEFPLPKNAIELESLSSSFSAESKHPLRISADRKGDIYVSDQRRSSVLIFDSRGEIKGQIGINKRGKNILDAPRGICVSSDIIFIQDFKRKEVASFSLDGTLLKSFGAPDFTDMEANERGDLFIASAVLDKDKPIIDVYSREGKKLYSFGDGWKFAHSLSTLNSCRLALNDSGEIFVAFDYFPVVRRYTQRGSLISEWRIPNDAMEAKEKFNLRRIGEGMADPTRRYGYMKIICGIRSVNDRIYILSTFPRLEILEMDEEGRMLATYWKDHDEIYMAEDFLVQKSSGRLMFYVLRSSLDPNVDLYHPITKKDP